MPIEINYDNELDCLILKVLGTVRYSDIRTWPDQIAEHSSHKENLDKIIDCSDGHFDVKMSESESIPKIFLDSSEKLGDRRRTAIVAPFDSDFGRARQFDIIHGINSGVDIASFRSYKEAADWLRS